MSFNKCQRRPNSLVPQWDRKQGVEISYPALNECTVCFEYEKLESKSIMKSLQLGNGMYLFCLELFMHCNCKSDAYSSISFMFTPSYHRESNLNVALVSINGEILCNNALFNGT